MITNSDFSIGIEFSINSYCGKTRRLKGSSGKFHNRLITSLKPHMFNGVNISDIQIGDNDANPIANDMNVRNVIPSVYEGMLVNETMTVDVSLANNVILNQNNTVMVAVNIPEGEVRYVREVGIQNFNRALVRSPSGKKYGLHVVNGDLLEIKLRTTINLTITNLTAPVTLLNNGQVVQTVNARQEFYTATYASENPSFVLPTGHNSISYNWWELLKGKSGLWMKPNISGNQSTWFSPDFVNKFYDVVTDKNIFSGNFLTASGTQIKQIVGYTGVRNVLLVLTFDEPLELPHEVTNIKLEMKLSGDL